MRRTGAMKNLFSRRGRGTGVLKMPLEKRVVITGLGVIAPNGIGKAEFWQAMREGKSGVDLIRHFDASLFNSRICAAVKNFNPLDFMPQELARRVDRFVHLGLASCKLALADAGLDLSHEDRKKIGVIIGSGLGGQFFHEEQMMVAYAKGADKVNPRCIPKITPNAVSSNIAIQYNLQGPNMVISTACSSGTMGIGEALGYLRNSDMEICISGGVEAPLTRFCFGAYDGMGALSRRNALPQEASRPFDKDRDGFVLGEGAAILVLEELNHALKRGAHIYAELIGYNCNSGAYNMVAPLPSGEDAARAMRGALDDAKTAPAEIDYINAHGTSTVYNDRVETKAIKEVFKEYAYKLPVSSIKSMIGHTLGAAGAIEAATCCFAIEDQIIPPTINYQHQDPECDLDYVPNLARAAKLKTVLSNSFGFGSTNACLVFRKIATC